MNSFLKYDDEVKIQGVVQLAKAWLNRAEHPLDQNNKDSYDAFVYSFFAFNAIYSLIELENQLKQKQKIQKSRSVDIDKPKTDKPKTNIEQILEAFKRAQKSQSFNNALGSIGMSDDFNWFVNRGTIKRMNSDQTIWITRQHESMLRALYYARCNLFHGDKNFHNDSDTAVISRAASLMIKYDNAFIQAIESDPILFPKKK